MYTDYGGYQDPGIIDYVIIFGGNLLQTAILILIVYFLYRGVKRYLGYGSTEQLSPAGDTLRFALASSVLRGAVFRRAVLAAERHPFRAKAPEFGLDVALVAAACRHFEARDIAFAWAITLLALGALLTLGHPLVLLLLAGVVVAKQWRDRFVLAKPFRRENFSVEDAYRRFGITPEPVQQNLICYGTASPFVGLGQWIGSWSVPLDPRRAAPERDTPPEPTSPAEINEIIARSVVDLNIVGLTLHDAVFVSGTEVNQFPEILPDPYARPALWVDGNAVRSFREGSDFRARGYRWFSIEDWDGDLVYSFLYRCVQRGDTLFFEATRVTLGPVAPEYRTIDSLRRPGFRSALAWAMGALLWIPFVILGALVSASASIGHAVATVLARETFRERREIRENPTYNYGATISIRELMSSAKGSAYFRLIDENLYAQMLDHRVLRTLIDHLASKGIDTSILEEQAMTVVNNTTFVNRGTVVSQSNVSGIVAGARSTIASAGSGHQGAKA